MKPPLGSAQRCARAGLKASAAIALEVLCSRIEIGIARWGLELAVDEKLVGGELARHLGLHDPIAIGLPVQIGAPVPPLTITSSPGAAA